MTSSPAESSSLDAEVILVGAGPVGLFLAHLLGRAGLSTLLLEKRQPAPRPSMAIGVMPPSLKMFETIGLATPIVQAGCPVRSAYVHDACSTLGSLSFTGLPGPFPFILSIPQGELMRLLRERLDDQPSVRCLEGCEAIGVRQRPGCVSVRVREAGEAAARELTAAFVVACDGRNSPMRGFLGVPVAGSRYPDAFVMGDFPDTTSWLGDAHLFFTAGGSVESFPLPQGWRRWIALTGSPDPGPEVLTAQVLAITGWRLEASAAAWHSAFTPERLLARSFFQDRAVLCGDAAHVMSPIGGQGMNTGFADAWQLAAILGRLKATGEAHAPLLSQYESDRRRAFRIAADRAARDMWLGTRTGRISSALRGFLIRQALASPPCSSWMARYFAMLDIPGGLDPCAAPASLDPQAGSP